MPTFVPHDAPVLAPLPTREEAARWVESVDNALMRLAAIDRLSGREWRLEAKLALSNLQRAYVRASVRIEQLEARLEADDE